MRIILLTEVKTEANNIKQTLQAFNPEFKCTIVRTRQELLAALTKIKTKIVISDYTMTSFHGIEALDIVLKEAPSTPFVFISDAIENKSQLLTILPGVSAIVGKNQLEGLPNIVTMALNGFTNKKQFQTRHIQNILSHISLQFELLSEYLTTLDDDAAELRKKLRDIKKNIQSIKL